MTSPTLPRTLFGQPIRAGTTAEFFPDPITLDEFVQLIHGNVDAFAQNVRAYPPWDQPMYVEEWAERFLAWSEIEPE